MQNGFINTFCEMTYVPYSQDKKCAHRARMEQDKDFYDWVLFLPFEPLFSSGGPVQDPVLTMGLPPKLTDLYHRPSVST